MNVIDYLQNLNTEEKMTSLIYDNLFYYQNLDTNDKIDCVSADIYNWFVQECVQNNQYLVIKDELYTSILNLYRDLILKLREISIEEKNRKRIVISDIVRYHRKNLISILENVSDIDYDSSHIIPCSEYSIDLQLKVLRLNISEIKEPVLDIGCGKKHSLVTKLVLLGIDAYGIDQYLSSDKSIICKNWLQYDFSSKKWGTIISHMAFTNHYRRNLNRKNDLSDNYKTKFEQIINSLKAGGIFVYTPSLPEIESILNTDYFDITHSVNVPGDKVLNTTQIKRKIN